MEKQKYCLGYTQQRLRERPSRLNPPPQPVKRLPSV